METTDEKPELPEICKKYDEVSDTIVTYESDIKSMEDEVTEKTEKIKEYLGILKTGSGAGIDPGEFLIMYPLSYYRNKIQELNDELIEMDDELKSKKAILQDYYKEIEEIAELIPASGMVKINYIGPLISLDGRIKWITFEEWNEKYKKAVWTKRIV